MKTIRYLIVVLMLFLATSSAHALSTTASPATCVNDASVGASAWVLGAPLPATSSMPDLLNSNYLKCTGFGFSIPTGSAINGITTTVVVNCSKNNQCEDGSVKIVKTGTISGTDHAGNNPSQFWGRPQTRTYGSTADLWGATWFATDINAANFGLVISASNRKGGGTATNATVTSIGVAVDYTLPPTVAKSFSPTTILTGTSSTLTITLTNPNTVALTSVAMTDAYPTNLVNAGTPAGSTTCLGGTVTAVASGASVALSGATIPASGSCTLTVSVTSSTLGSYNNNVLIGAVTFPNGGFNAAASNIATLTVLSPPGVTKSFGTNPIVAGGTSLLTITLSNTNAIAITGVAFTDTYPAGVTNSTTASTTCGGAATAVVNGGTVALSAGTIPPGSSCTVTVTVKASAAGSYANGIAVGAVTSANAGSNTLAASDTLTVNAAVGAFDAYETATAPATATSGVIKTKIAGASFSLDIIALNAAKTVMQTGFTNVVKVELLGNINTGVSLDANGCPVTFGLDQVVSPDPTLNNGRQTLTFAAVSNAWKDVRVKVSYPAVSPTVVSCSRDNFAIRPNTFTLSATDTDPQTAGTTRTLANTTATSGNAHKAGMPFTIQATAVNAAGTPATTTNYANSPTTTLSTCVGTACTASLGTLTVVTTFASGTLTSNLATYTEVGSFGLTLQDQTFANVDAADSSTAERYITSSTINVGRFVPDHFALTTTGVSAPALTNRSEVSPLCSPASAFTYMAEPMSISFQLLAQNASGVTTANYAGALARLDLSSASSFGFGAIDSTLTTPRTVPISALTQANPGNVTATGHGFSTGDKVFLSGVTGMTQVNNLTYTVTFVDANNFTIGTNTSGFSAYIAGGTASRLSVPTVTGSWAAGVASVVATMQFERGANPDGPFNGLQVGIAPTDPDGIQLQSSAFNLDADGNGTSERARLATTQMRFGRLRLLNAFGTTLLNLPLTLTAEYFNTGGFFATNTLDSCTTIAANNIRMAFVAGTPNLIACETALSPTGTISFNGGKASPLKLTLPGSGNDGAVDLTVNLNGASGGNTCTPSATPVTNAGKSWLQGNWGSGSYSDDPRGRATFGIFKNPDQFIYFRENF